MTLVEALGTVVRSFPAATFLPVPRELLLELLEGLKQEADNYGDNNELTVEEVAAEFKKKTSTVRGWLDRGDFPGAYKLNGKAWRVPRSGIAHFRLQQKKGKTMPATTIHKITGLPKSSDKLSDWRLSSNPKKGGAP